jgi:O-antigen ligase
VTAIGNVGLKEPAARSSRNRMAFTIENVFCIFLIAGLAWVPFWIGGNRGYPWGINSTVFSPGLLEDRLIPWGINAVLFPGMVAVYEILLVVRRLPHPTPLRRIRLSVILFTTVVAWIFIQNAAWTPVEWQHPVWQLASDALGRDIRGSISVDRDLTALALIRLLTSASVFWLALQLCCDARRARLLLWSIAGIVAAYAAIGLLGLGLFPSGHFVSSTFVNRNNYATYDGIGFVSILGLIPKFYSRELRGGGDNLRLKIALLISSMGTKGAIPLMLAFVILAALLLSGSRGGIMSTMLGVLVLLIHIALRSRRRFGLNEAGFIVVVVLAIGAVFFSFGDLLAGRIETQGLGDAWRLDMYRITGQSILSAPLLGYGYGTFASVFAMFRDSSIDVWPALDMAHNTYLEVLQGLGLVFGGALIGSVVLLVVQCLKASVVLRRDATLPAVAAGVSFLVGMHALVDFSLQIQPVTLTFMAVLGAGVAVSHSGS